MGKKSAPTPPKPPDPYEVAGAQQAFNTFNQDTPFGGISFTAPTFNGDDTVNEFGTATINLSPEMQAIVDNQTAITGNTLEQALALQSQQTAAPLDTSGLNERVSSFDIPDFSSVRDDLFSQASELINRDRATQEDSLRQTLANQGLPQSGAAFANEFGAFNRGYGDAISNAALQATLQAGQEQSRQAGLNQALASFGNTARVEGFNELAGLDSYQRNQLASLLGLQQVGAPTMSSFFAPGATDFIGAQGLETSAQQANYQAQVARQNAGLSGLFGLGGALLGNTSLFGG